MFSSVRKIDLRKGWPHEALDFTRWLSEEVNLAMLSEEVGIEIKLLQTEANVGSFNVDILGEELNTSRKVIIENQLEVTDHTHLGQIITYASGIDAEFIIWVVKEARDEHRQAIDWLNEHTDESTNFFLIKIELWQISGSPYAPKFQVVSEPNDWTKVLRHRGSSELTETKLMQLEFWRGFRSYTQEKGTTLRLRKPLPQHWYDFSYGRSDSQISLTINTRESELGCEVYIPNSPERFEELYSKKAEIESRVGEELEWMPLPGKKASRIKLVRSFELSSDFSVSDFEWLQKMAEKFQEVFGSL